MWQVTRLMTGVCCLAGYQAHDWSLLCGRLPGSEGCRGAGAAGEDGGGDSVAAHHQSPVVNAGVQLAIHVHQPEPSGQLFISPA